MIYGVTICVYITYQIYEQFWRVFHNNLRIASADYTRPKSFVRVPFFKEQDLLTSASLNGGGVFAEFINMITEWTRIFAPSVTEEEVYEQLITKAGALDPTSK